MTGPHTGARLRTERDVIESLRGRTVSLDDLYAACAAAGVTHRDDGDAVVHGRSDTRSRRRLRGALQTLRRAGGAQRVADGTWLIEGPQESPRRMLLVLTGDISRIELVLSTAERLLRQTEDEPALIFADPPWGLGVNATGRRDRDNCERTYARDPELVVGGYVDVSPAEYPEFTHRWVAAAVQILRPGAYLAVVTGPGQSARVQTTAEDLGLEFVNQIVVPRPFALPTSRRFSHAHTVITVMCAPGARRTEQRFFAVPQDLPKAASGRDYPLDVWSDLGKHERRGLVRYPTMLHPAIPSRVIRALTPGPENGGHAWQSLVVDPFAMRKWSVSRDRWPSSS